MGLSFTRIIIRYVYKDEDVKFYTDRGIEISYNNIHEFQL